MELPCETEGRKATHDFLSLYSSPSAHAQQDPAPPQGSFLKTQDFLQPLERVGNNTITRGGMAAVGKAPLPGGPHGSVERHLPGGFGTHSISYINQRSIKPAQGSLFATTAQENSTTRNDENLTSSSYPENDFALWDESAVHMGKIGRENITVTAEVHALQEAGMTLVGGQWPSLNKPSSNHYPINATISSFSSSQPLTSQTSQSFMDMITSAKNDLDEDEEEEDDFIIKKESSPHPKGNLSGKVEAKTIDQKPNTPRSKHSATEQRRRSKINDRFLKLREVIPNSDQKRDKASFLLEAIRYIQFLQEKVSRYESSYDARSHDPSKITYWVKRNLHIAEGFVSQAAKNECGPASVFPGEKKARGSPSIPINGQNLIDSDTSAAAGFRERGQQPELASKATPSQQTIQPNTSTLGRTSSPVSPKQETDIDRTMIWPPSQFQHKRLLTPDCSDNRANDKELTIESGTINISSIYSQELLNTLSQALHKSGVDLSQASLSVQIDLGKKSSADSIPHSSPSAAKEDDVPAALPPSQTTSISEDFDRTIKKHRTC